MKRFLQVLVILFLFQTQVKANHVMGGEITYRYLGGLKYEVTCKFYRDCRGIPLSSPSCNMIGNGDTSKKKNLSLTLISIRDVSNYCKKNSNPCGKANTSGASLGIEEHLYLDTVDFNKADSAFKKYCNIQFGMGQCCRNIGGDFWVTAYLNICKSPKNSSPALTNIPKNILCCNQPVYYNNGASDTIDNDSISYSFDTPMTGYVTYITYSGGKTKSNPFSDYWPSGYDKKKGPNPSTNPPIGTYLDPETGDLIFTPTDCSEETYATIKMTEWRKDSTGKYNIVGIVFRDLMYLVQSCSANNPPTLSGPYKFEVCAVNKICFIVVSDDKQIIPPPPAKANPPDTVTLTWNHGINKGATFKIIDTTARLQRGQFCWTPKESDASDLPYTFTVTEKDNNCPTNGITIKSYSIKVKKNAKTTITKTFIKNGLYQLRSDVEKGFKGTAQYFWEISDSVNNPIDTGFYFYPSNSLRSNRQLDSVQFYHGGRYIIHHRINNPPLNCPTDYFDTLKVAPVTPILRISPKSLQEKWVCKNSVDTIFPLLKNEKKPVKYRWSSSSADTLPYLIIDNKKDSMYRVDVYDGAGYHQFATWKFYTYQEPILTIGKSILACVGDTVLLEPIVSNYTDTVFWKWTFKGNQISTDSKIKVVKPGLYNLEITDSLKCVLKIDSIKVSNMIVNVDGGRDRKVCVNDTVMLNAKGIDTSNGKKGDYYWYINKLTSKASDTGNIILYKFKTDTTMIVKLLQSKGTLTCSDLDTLAVSFRPLPPIALKNGTICQNETELDLHTIILKPTNSYTGIVSWQLLKTLQKPSGADNSISDLVYDKDNTSSDHYYLKVDKSTIDLKPKFMDSVMLGLTYKDEFGCQNSSSKAATIVIRSNVDVTFNTNEQKRCYGDSVVYISNDYGVNYYGGKWFTNNDSSNYLKWSQGNAVQLSEKLGTKSLDAKGGKYMLKYTLENNKCLSSKNAILTIIPYPAIVWAQTDQGDSVVLTDKSTNEERREWYINSKKMSEAKSFTVSKSDAKIKSIVLKVFNSNCETDSVIVPKIVVKIINLNTIDFSISPNPVRDELLIKTGFSQPYKIQIINSLGQLVLKKSMGRNLETINVSELPDGIYSIILKTSNDILMQKFIKTSY